MTYVVTVKSSVTGAPDFMVTYTQARVDVRKGVLVITANLDGRLLAMYGRNSWTSVKIA